MVSDKAMTRFSRIPEVQHVSRYYVRTNAFIIDKSTRYHDMVMTINVDHSTGMISPFKVQCWSLSPCLIGVDESLV